MSENPDPAITSFPHPIIREKLLVSAEEKKSKIKTKFKEILEILGLDISSPSLRDTPGRVAKMYVEEIFSGLNPESFPEITFYEEEIPQESIFIKNISLISYCEHHLVPMIGFAHVAYLPKKKLLGFSKINRIVRYFGARPQLQERLTAQIADSLALLLETEDIAVCTQAKHFCVIARGVKDPQSEVQSVILRGRYEKDATLRSEFFSRLSMNGPGEPEK